MESQLSKSFYPEWETETKNLKLKTKNTKKTENEKMTTLTKTEAVETITKLAEEHLDDVNVNVWEKDNVCRIYLNTRTLHGKSSSYGFFHVENGSWKHVSVKRQETPPVKFYKAVEVAEGLSL